MRNFRNTAVASATALTVLVSGLGIASAAEADSNGTVAFSPEQVTYIVSFLPKTEKFDEIKKIENPEERAQKLNEYLNSDEGKGYRATIENELAKYTTVAPQTQVKPDADRGGFGDTLFAGFNRNGDDRLSGGNDVKFGEFVSDVFKPDVTDAQIGRKTEGDRAVRKQDMLGSSTDVANVPQWARIWNETLSIAGIGTIIGLIIAGVNYASYNGWIQLPSL